MAEDYDNMKTFIDEPINIFFNFKVSKFIFSKDIQTIIKSVKKK